MKCKCLKDNALLIRWGKINNVQRYRCKSCKVSFVSRYKYKAYEQSTNNFIVSHLKESCSIRGISRLAGISKNTVMRRIKKIADGIQLPYIIKATLKGFDFSKAGYTAEVTITAQRGLFSGEGGYNFSDFSFRQQTMLVSDRLSSGFLKDMAHFMADMNPMVSATNAYQGYTSGSNIYGQETSQGENALNLASAIPLGKFAAIGLKSVGGAALIAGVTRVPKALFGLRKVGDASSKMLVSSGIAFKLGLTGTIKPTLTPWIGSNGQFLKAKTMETFIGRWTAVGGAGLIGAGYATDYFGQ